MTRPTHQAILTAAGTLLDWADQAPPLLQARVEKQLERVEAGLKELESHPLKHTLDPELDFEWARLEGFRGRSSAALERLERVLHHPRLPEIAGLADRAQQLQQALNQADYELELLEPAYLPPTLAQWQRMLKVLSGLPTLLEKAGRDGLKQPCVDFLSDLFDAHQVFWLEPGAGPADPWNVLAYVGPPGFAIYSRQLLKQALAEGSLITEPQPISPYESLVLSDARGVIVFVLPDQSAALYLSHREFLGRYQDQEMSVLRFVAQIVWHYSKSQQLHRKNLEAARERLELCQRLCQALQESPFGVAWLQRDGTLVEANPAYSRHHVSPRPYWDDLWRPDQEKARTWFEGALVQSGVHTDCFRLAGEQVQWLNYFVDATSGPPYLCVTQDLGELHWQDSLAVLERERHWLAGDLHDGPAQLAAALALQGGRGLEPVRDAMEWLRSPLFEAQSPLEAVQELFASHLPEVKFDWPHPRTGWCPRLLLCFRLLQDLLETASEGYTSLSVRLEIEGDGEWEVRLTGIECREYRPAPEIAARLELFQCELGTNSCGLQLQVSQPKEPPP